jgi:hypothetical protein
VVLAAAVVAARAALPAQEIVVRLAGDHLRVSAPKLRFLTGKPLESLRNGASVAFDIQVSILGDGRQTVLRRNFERFVISYDLWEERFSVARMRSTRSSASHLTALAAEAWCLDGFALPVAGLPRDKPLHVRVDIRAQNGRQRQENEGDEGLSLGALIDLFSRPARPGDPMHWRAESGPIRIAELQKAASL